MSVDLLHDEKILWQGSPAHRSVFLRMDLAWMWFSLKFNAVVVLIMAVVVVLAGTWRDLADFWLAGLALFVVTVAMYFVEPFAWRYLTLRRTTYYVTDQRVLSVPGRRARAVRLSDIDVLVAVVEPDGSGHLRLDRRIMPDGFGHRRVAELIHVPDVRDMVGLLSTLTGHTPIVR